MAPSVLAFVLFAAFLHASWNAIVKSIKIDPLARATLYNFPAGVLAIVLIPYFGLPPEAALPYLLVSVLCQIGYAITLSFAYHYGDMSQVYPITRGSGLALTLLLGSLWAGDEFDVIRWTAVLLITTGVFLLLAPVRAGLKFSWWPAVLALSVGMMNSVAVVCDGLGARVSTNAFAYIVAMYALQGIGTLIIALAWRGTVICHDIRKEWRRGVSSSLLSLIVYGIAVWAMTRAPIPIVAAVRETSILFGAVIAFVWLKEAPSTLRILGAILIFAGVTTVQYPF